MPRFTRATVWDMNWLSVRRNELTNKNVTAINLGMVVTSACSWPQVPHRSHWFPFHLLSLPGLRQLYGHRCCRPHFDWGRLQELFGKRVSEHVAPSCPLRGLRPFFSCTLGQAQSWRVSWELRRWVSAGCLVLPRAPATLGTRNCSAPCSCIAFDASRAHACYLAPPLNGRPV